MTTLNSPWEHIGADDRIDLQFASCRMASTNGLVPLRLRSILVILRLSLSLLFVRSFTCSFARSYFLTFFFFFFFLRWFLLCSVFNKRENLIFFKWHDYNFLFRISIFSLFFHSHNFHSLPFFNLLFFLLTPSLLLHILLGITTSFPLQAI